MKQLLALVMVLTTLQVFSQKDFQGKAVYMSKTTFDMSRFGSEMSEQRKKQIKDRMKSFLEKTFVLNFNKTEALYKQEATLGAPGGGGGRGFRFGGASSTIYSNTIESKMIESTEFFGKNFLITEKLSDQNWELSAETKKIGNYTCYKATLLKELPSNPWEAFRRGGNDNKKDSTKVKDKEPKTNKVLVTAWYTPQIPVASGPKGYGGLPGLILELSEDRTTILCTEVVLNTAEKVEIKEPVKGKQTSREEFNKLTRQKMEEMRERFRGRGRGGRGMRH